MRAGLGVRKCVMVPREVVSTGRRDCLQLMVGNPPAKMPP